MTTPQQVTERYVNNLLRNGQNKEYRLLNLQHKPAIVDDICVGIYYECNVGTQHDFETKHAAGATPSEAIRRVLAKFGVTFR